MAAAAAVIHAELSDIEAMYEELGIAVPEHLSLAASAADMVANRHIYAKHDRYTRSDIRDHLDCLDPDELLGSGDIARLKRMAR